jgi:hypothetical protein
LDCWTVGLLNILIFKKIYSALYGLDCWTVGLLNILIFKKNLEQFRAWTVGLLNIIIFQKKFRAL